MITQDVAWRPSPETVADANLTKFMTACGVADYDALLRWSIDEPEAFYRQLEMGLEEAYAFTSDVIVDNALGRDFEEGLSAFVEKRKPVWPTS